MKHRLRSVGLRGDAQTSVLPLWARAVESRRGDGLFVDAAAERWAEHLARLGVAMPGAMAGRGSMRSTQAGLAIRTAVFDRWVRDWARAEATGGGDSGSNSGGKSGGNSGGNSSGAVVVDLGVGLCTRSQRLRDLGVDWCLLDRAEVLALRASLTRQADGDVTADAAALVEADWSAGPGAGPRAIRDADGVMSAAGAMGATLDRVAERVAGRRVCFVAEGLLMYLPEPLALGLLGRLWERFPGATLLADVLARWQVWVQGCHDTLGLTEGVYAWGTGNAVAWCGGAAAAARADISPDGEGRRDDWDDRPGQEEWHGRDAVEGWRVVERCGFADAVGMPNAATYRRMAPAYRSATRVLSHWLGDYAMLRLWAT